MPRFALALLLALLLPAAAAHAAPDAEVGIEDERLLLSEPDKAPAAIAAWRAMGVEVVRIHARWFEIAPAQRARRRPRGFDPADHRDRRYDWARLDRAIVLLRAAELRVLLTVTGPGPIWSTRSPRRRNPRYEPDPRQFGRFARAVADRYGASVDRYSIWNEPNNSGWLQPQAACRSRGKGKPKACVLASPHLYRDLVRAAGPAIERADPGAEILAGELAPTGVEKLTGGNPVAPLTFLRAFGCVDERYRALRSGRCRDFSPARADALAYHPHGVKNGPERANPDRNSAQIADLERLEQVLDRLTRRGRIRSPGGDPLPLHLTEFSYQTSPPDPAVGVSLTKQAVFQQQAAYVAWRDPRVRSLVQYQWDDELTRNKGAGSKRYAGWQGGLRFYDGREKPAKAAFETPFVVDVARDGSGARLWGQIRPGGAHTVAILRGPLEGGPLEVVSTIQTGPMGTWTLPVVLPEPVRYAAAWTAPDGSTRTTPVLAVDSGAGGRILAGSK